MREEHFVAHIAQNQRYVNFFDLISSRLSYFRLVAFDTMEVALAKLGGEDNKLAKLYNGLVNSPGAKGRR